MLFRPHTKKYILGHGVPFTPGLIPKRRYLLAQKTARAISEYLLTDETLVEHVCGEDVKAGFEKLLDALPEAAMCSGKTLSGLLFGENRPDLAFEAVSEHIIGSLSPKDFARAAEKLDDSLLSGVRLGGLLSSSLTEGIREWIINNTDKISGKLLELVNSEFFEENVRPVALEIINGSVKGLASLFVVPESVYGSFRESLSDYLREPANYDETSRRLVEIYERLLEADISEMARSIAGEGGRPVSGLVARLEDNGGVLPEIIKLAGEATSRRLVCAVLSLKLKDVFAAIDGKLFGLIKGAVMSRYEGIVRSNLPAVLAAIDIAGVIENRINEFKMQEAEDIIVSVVDRELAAITYFGGALGFAIGLVPPVMQSFG